MKLELKQDSTLDIDERNNCGVPSLKITADMLHELTHGGMISLVIDGKQAAVIWTSEQFKPLFE